MDKSKIKYLVGITLEARQKGEVRVQASYEGDLYFFNSTVTNILKIEKLSMMRKVFFITELIDYYSKLTYFPCIRGGLYTGRVIKDCAKYLNSSDLPTRATNVVDTLYRIKKEFGSIPECLLAVTALFTKGRPQYIVQLQKILNKEDMLYVKSRSFGA